MTVSQSSNALVEKACRKIRGTVVRKLRQTRLYPFLYPGYWHSRFIAPSPQAEPCATYLTAVPNPGAGIGHQMANWIAGMWFARKFGLRFAHTPFASPAWEEFLGFGVGEIDARSLAAGGRHRRVSLPLFDEGNAQEIARVGKIIDSYRGRPTLFVLEQDQFYEDQFGVAEQISQKFHRAPARSDDRLIFGNETLNIAVHVRRGDIVVGQSNGNSNLQMRWQDHGYFETALQTVVDNLKSNRPIRILLFSQGAPEDFATFSRFPGLEMHLEMSAQDSFLHMARADILITSKSSFSYKPALLSGGFKICPADFWHGYPNTPDWILADDSGRFDPALLPDFTRSA